MAGAGRNQGDHSASQDVRFCRAPDGVRIAYAVHGSGPPLVVTTCWLSHLQFDWESPVWRHFLADLGRVATIIRYDERGHGLSDWDVTDHSLSARIGDFEAVIEDAGLGAGAPPFALMAMAQGGPVAISYAAAHPERVSRLLFYGSYSNRMRGATPEDFELHAVYGRMIRVGWSRPDANFRRVFTSMMIPGATAEQMSWLDELQLRAVSGETAYLARKQRGKDDTDHLLGELSQPTLVLHSRGDQMSGFEQGRYLASNIAGARLVALDSRNHILLEGEPAWPELIREVTDFLAPERGTSAPSPPHAGPPLSPREVEVLDLAAEGLDNDGIADRLTLSTRTVERHLQNAYTKLGVTGRTARTAAVARHLRG